MWVRRSVSGQCGSGRASREVLMLGGERWRTERVVNRGRGGLVLIPVVLGSCYVLIKKNMSTQITVRYPARGAGALWTAGTQAPARSAVRLLGRARAELLEALRSPATTTDLARALGVTPSALVAQEDLDRTGRCDPPLGHIRLGVP
jgi:hypothetical protein